MKRKLNARLQYARFLQDTVKEMAKEIQTSRSGEVRNTAEDLDEFMNKVDFNLFSPFHKGKLALFHFIFDVSTVWLYSAVQQVRKGERVSNDEILGFAKFFNDELTLDNISRLYFLLLN